MAQSVVIYDRVLTYEACPPTGGVDTNLTNGVSAARYAADGQRGLRVTLTAQTGAAVASAPTGTITYTDQGGNSGGAGSFGFTYSGNSGKMAWFTPAVTGGASVPTAASYTTGEGPYLWLPLASGDTGVRSIQSYSITGGWTATLAFVLNAPIAIVPIVSTNASMMDLAFQLPGMPRIYDGACLSLFANMTGGGQLLVGGTVAWD
jgi:hypothetical protein